MYLVRLISLMSYNSSGNIIFLQLRHTYASGHCGAEDTKSGKSCIAPFLIIACLEYKNGALSSLGR